MIRFIKRCAWFALFMVVSAIVNTIALAALAAGVVWGLMLKLWDELRWHWELACDAVRDGERKKR